MTPNLWAIRRKADGQWFPLSIGNSRSWVEFTDVGKPARLPARTFTSKGAAKGTLTNWLRGGLLKVWPEGKGQNTYMFDPDYYEPPVQLVPQHDPKRGTAADYEILPVHLVPVQEQLL